MTVRSLRSALLSALAGLALTLPAAADFRDGLKNNDTIVVGTTGSAPPFTMIDSRGELDGFDIAFMKRAAEKLGVKVEFVQLDWSGLLPGLIANRFDVVASGVTRTAQRLESKDLIMLSPYVINGVAVTRLTQNDGIKSWDDICGKRAGVIRGSAELGLIRTAVPDTCTFSVSEYPGWTEMLLDLRNGRIEWVGMDYLGPAYLAKEDPTLTVLPEVRAPKTQSLAVSPSDPELAKALDEVIAAERADGSLNQLVERYFGQGVDFGNLPPDPKS